CMQGRQFPLTF
nr:immunoglobulin light chain junction region [Macaca mulatta]MPN87555.1 immunoglobulin light chain junction region [Macaca mulatta]MPN88936.1 immunoglobulin light chain junction region [Macaca mulatta]MPN89539.1 immunoglobulin light chain junction region [Macaca mulatta]